MGSLLKRGTGSGRSRWAPPGGAGKQEHKIHWRTERRIVGENNRPRRPGSQPSGGDNEELRVWFSASPWKEQAEELDRTQLCWRRGRVRGEKGVRMNELCKGK